MYDMLLSVVQEFFNLGATVLLPFVIAVIGLFFRMKPSKAIRSGLLVGIGFQGLVLTINLLMSTIQPVLDYYSSMGSGYDVVEIGFAALGAACWTVPFAVFVVPAIFLANILLVRLKATKTLNVDIWNFMHFLVPGGLAYALSGNAVIGFAVTLACGVITLFIADRVAKPWQDFFGLEGTTCSTFSLIAFTYPISWLINLIIDHVPGLNKVDFSLDKIPSQLSFLGNPEMIGLIAGLFLSLMTFQPIPNILTVCIGMSAVMLLIPRMVAIMMEGLTSLGNAANTYTKSKLGEDAEIYIGMDIALGLGDPTCITATAIMIPIVIGLSFLIPDMRFFPLGILAEVCYIAPMAAMTSRGNLLRTLLCMSAVFFIAMWLMSINADFCTQFLNICNVDFAGTAVTASHFGWNPGALIVCGVAKVFGL